MKTVLGINCYEINDIVDNLNGRKSRATILRDVKSGKLPAEKVQNNWLVKPDDFYHYKMGNLAKIYSFPNQKGGVGKTTSCQNIGAGLARRGYKVLLIDFDPQANLTSAFNYSPYDVDYTIYEVLSGYCDISKSILKLNDNLFLIPSHSNLSNIELKYNRVEDNDLLKNHIEPIKYDYDFILIDSPPTIGFLTVNTLVASEKVFVPVYTEPLAINGLADFFDSYQEVKDDYAPELEFGGVIITKTDFKRNKMERNILNDMRDFFAYKDEYLFESFVPINISLPEAQMSGLSIFDHKPHSKGAMGYDKVITEILKIAKGRM